MNCPYCSHIETKVTDSRDTGDYTIRRRRECLKCNRRFTTYEHIEMTPIYVIKKDGRREKFERNKIKRGIEKALEKRPIGHEKIDEMLDVIEPVVMTEVDEEDYTTTDSGLMYYDIVEGNGETPTEGQTVVVHYTGWLEDGTKFDSSLDRGQTFSFPLGMGSVIPGWDEGVATMKVGTLRQLKIPAELAYGETGQGIIPPGATLIFEVELLAIQE